MRLFTCTLSTAETHIFTISVADPDGAQGVRSNPSPRPLFLNTL